MKRNHNTFQRREPEQGEHSFLPLTKDGIEEIRKAVQADPIYEPQWREIESFLTKHPQNDDRDIVIHKILLIDFTNSTNLRFRSSEDFSIFTTDKGCVFYNVSASFDVANASALADVSGLDNKLGMQKGGLLA